MRRHAAFPIGVLATVSVLACAAGTDSNLHGNNFTFDGGADAALANDAESRVSDAHADGAADALYDGSESGEDASDGSAPSDGPVVIDDAGVDATTDASGDADASSLLDASDGSSDAADSGQDAPLCTATRALLGGGAVSLFGAMSTGTAPLVPQSVAGTLGSAPAVVAFGGGYAGLVTAAADAGGGNAVSSISYTSNWSAPVALGAGANALGSPALAPVGSTLQGAYLNPSHVYFQALYTSSWDSGGDAVRPSVDGGVQAFGPVAPAAAGTSTDFVIAYEGNNLLPYAQTWTADAGWDNGVALASVTVATDTPLAIAPLTPGGTNDLIAVFVDGEGSSSGNNLHLFATFRTAASRAWSSPAMINTDAYTNGAPALTTVSGGRALVAWPGQSVGSGIYSSVYTPGAGTPWSAPIQVTTMSGPISLAAGTCGNDAEAAIVSGGTVYTLHLAGGTWSAPSPVSGVTGATYATIATTP